MICPRDGQTQLNSQNGNNNNARHQTTHLVMAKRKQAKQVQYLSWPNQWAEPVYFSHFSLSHQSPITQPSPSSLNSTTAMFNVVVLLTCCATIASAGPTSGADETLKKIDFILGKLFVHSGTPPEYHDSALPMKAIKDVRKFGRSNAQPCFVYLGLPGPSWGFPSLS